MEVPLDITYRNVEKTEALETLIRKKVVILEKVCGHLSSCRIAIEKAQHERAALLIVCTSLVVRSHFSNEQLKQINQGFWQFLKKKGFGKNSKETNWRNQNSGQKERDQEARSATLP